MSLALSLDNALTGLQAAQNNLAVIAGNIANANTPGYSRQVLTQTQIDDGQGGQGVSTSVAQRISDPILVANLNNQNSVTSAATTLSTYYQDIQNLFGSVGGANSLSDSYNTFTSAMQTLAATPEDTVAQENAVSAGQTLASQLNAMSSGIQSLRGNADTAIGDAVSQVNTLLNNIATYNAEIARARALNQSTATFEDQRDQAVQQLAQQMNVQTYTNADDSMVVTTPSGQTLVDGIAEQLSFTPTGTFNASIAGSGISINGLDITSDITGGNIGALLQMRDQQLPALTAELNQFTNQLYNAGQVATAQTQTMTGATAAGDQLTGTIDGVSFTTAALPANASPAQIAAAIQTAINPPNGPLPNISVIATGANTFQIIDAAGNPISSSVALAGGGTGTESFTASAPSNPATTQTQTFVGATAAGDRLTGTIDGVSFTTASLPANASAATIAAAIQTAINPPNGTLSNFSVVPTGAGAIQIVDSAGNPVTSTIAMAAGGTGTEVFTAGAATNPVMSTQLQTMSGATAAGDTVTAVIDGISVTTAALPVNATAAQIAAAIQAALPAALSSIQVTAPVVGNTPTPDLIQITDTAGNPLSSSLTMTAGGTGTETFAASAPSNPLPNTSNRFFTGVSPASGDNAATVEVDPSLVANPGLLDGTASVPSPSIALALADSFAQSTPTFPAAGNFSAPLTLTLSQYAGQILGQTSTAAANAQDNEQFQNSVLQSVSTQASAVSGVNMDEELSNLTIYQTAYSASARVIQAVDSMFNTLMQIQP
ncbi:MAG TPA: flagellar hook-associated protein FlgK [Stellaceae bacterium]|nr:flagellar hook-associated protein FlgK [Stellaceae bacterium]